MKKTKNIVKISKIKQRITWGFNPKTRVVKSKKLYSRKNIKKRDILNENYSKVAVAVGRSQNFL